MSEEKSELLANNSVDLLDQQDTSKLDNPELTEQSTMNQTNSEIGEQFNSNSDELNPQTPQTPEQNSQYDSSQKKRKNDFNDSNRSRKKFSKEDYEIRFLVSSKDAGALIGKRGSHITFLRQNFQSSVVVTDCNAPERILQFTVQSSQLEQILATVIGYLEENNQNPAIELRLLLHTHYIGKIIGKNGANLKEIRQKNHTSIKIFQKCCPRSSERVIIVQGQPSNVITCIRNILDVAFSNQLTGKIYYYNPVNYDINDAFNYGGFMPDTSINKARNSNRPALNRPFQRNSNRKRFNHQNSYNQPHQSDSWNRQSTSYNQSKDSYSNNWHQQSNQMNNYGLQSPVNCYQNSYQNNYQGQQSYYVDYQTNSNSQVYNGSKHDYSPVDVNNQLNPNNNWNSYNGSYNSGMPINEDRTNMA